MPEGLEVSTEETARALADKSARVVDVREPYERDAGYVEGTEHVELAQLSAAARAFDAEQPVILYCRVGGRSLMAAQALRSAGFDAYSMAGGVERWADEGGPLSPDGGYVADHCALHRACSRVGAGIAPTHPEARRGNVHRHRGFDPHHHLDHPAALE